MSLLYDDIEDVRYNPFTGLWTPKLIGYGANPTEDRVIPVAAPYLVKLYESPQENAPSTTRAVIGVTELQEVPITQTPASMQYRVCYDELGNGIVEFNSAQAGLTVKLSYYGLGHILQKLSLDTRVPASGNTSIAGVKTFTGSINIDTTEESNIEISKYDLSSPVSFTRTAANPNIEVKKPCLVVIIWPTRLMSTGNLSIEITGTGSGIYNIHSQSVDPAGYEKAFCLNPGIYKITYSGPGGGESDRTIYLIGGYGKGGNNPTGQVVALEDFIELL
jgi:Holliday junction resolvase